METRTLIWRTRRSARRVRWLVRHSVAKLATIDRGEWRDLVEAQAALLWAQALVLVRPTGQLVSPGSAGPAQAAQAAQETAPAPGDDRARRLALGVNRAAEFGLFRPLCLVRSVALSRLLERHGITGSRIRVGVRVVAGEFTAHAWVEHGGRVLGDDAAHVGGFASLSDVSVLRWR